MIGSTQSSQAADITSLAVRVGNLKAGIQASAGMAGTNETKRDRDDAVLVSERTGQLAEAVAQQQNASDTADDSGTSGGQRTRSAARQEMLASASTHYSGMVLNRSFLHDAMRLYSETGKV
ncbi:hypothetical protein [Roseicella sp. DB1501]|uniref:hypothetical protein n=1 Tax=Roseicella sp. DB1501 TaxID=2730925 RepID=UPI0014930A06|nr:hypothetical protein [Roseicella sp. DB1501]NOG71301.1 hypothetical protein [Roseicella sp. DB1501]